MLGREGDEVGRKLLGVGAAFTELSLRNRTFREEVQLKRAEIRSYIECDGARFCGPVSFEEAVLEFDAYFTDAHFLAETTFRGAEFAKDVIFQDTVFEGLVDFREVRIGARLVLAGAEFRGGVFF